MKVVEGNGGCEPVPGSSQMDESHSTTFDSNNKWPNSATFSPAALRFQVIKGAVEIPNSSP